METTERTTVTVAAAINAPVEKVWESWTNPRHITKWCNASDDWHAPCAENDVRKNGKFKMTMAARDGSVSFDFEGHYTNVQPNKVIEYTIADGRRVRVTFSSHGAATKVTETFQTENENPVEMQ